MPKFLLNRWHGLHVIGLFIFSLLLIGILFVDHRFVALTGLFVWLVLLYYTFLAEKGFRKEFYKYAMTISYRVKKAGNEVFHELPIGILLYNEEKIIEWHNPFISQMLNRETAVGDKLDEIFPELKAKKDKEKGDHFEISVEGKIYRVIAKAKERLLYFKDITEQAALFKRYEEEKIVIGIVMMDNLDEATQGMDEQSRSILLAKVTGEINNWAQTNELFLRRTASDKYLIILDEKKLKVLEQTRFDILDEVRDLTIDQKVPFTLSIGIAAGEDNLVNLGQMAQTSLDIVLGRGGDQAAVKDGQRLSFYGGRSNAVEKRTRIRARVISHALRDLIQESDNVVIMGHRMPDMDAVGAAIGVLKAAQVSDKEGYIVLEDSNPSIRRLMETIQEDEELSRWFITPEQALHLTNTRTLAVVVDTHKASMVAEPKLLQQTHRIVVVDHHRRGEEFINEATLVYMEPYASSTCELVTELLQYFNEHLTMSVLEATTLLAGIMVDTKSFALRTGARTFEAASFLRRNGADSALIQRMLKEDLDEYIQKAEIIRNVKIWHNHIAIAATEPTRKYSQLIIAQVADTLLNMTDIVASFVICERPDGLIGISARSLGEVNVQVIMERMGGGGHLTNAATQIEGTLEEATLRLKQVLEEMEAEEGLIE